MCHCEQCNVDVNEEYIHLEFIYIHFTETKDGILHEIPVLSHELRIISDVVTSIISNVTKIKSIKMIVVYS